MKMLSLTGAVILLFSSMYSTCNALTSFTECKHATVFFQKYNQESQDYTAEEEFSAYMEFLRASNFLLKREELINIDPANKCSDSLTNDILFHKALSLDNHLNKDKSNDVNLYIKAACHYYEYIEWFLQLDPKRADEVISYLSQGKSFTKNSWINKRIGSVAIYSMLQDFKKASNAEEAINRCELIYTTYNRLDIFSENVVIDWYEILRAVSTKRNTISDEQLLGIILSDSSLKNKWTTFVTFINEFLAENKDKKLTSKIRNIYTFIEMLKSNGISQ